ncbi:MAG: glycosyltransferase family 2 protein [Candidatus Heimdallarchaeota archaeon]|nr:glycosyltransferase family 2 protein [Candidatus Heimdallarchaeota archaeon]MCK5048357.1 glycosyltransferase family 2 protein [Candidatus Heimdallarchaeota archaeon]
MSSSEKTKTELEKPYLSVVVPVYNEEESITELLTELKENLEQYSYEILTINDGSTDKTLEVLKEQLPLFKGKLRIINLATNRGQTSALKAGFDNVRGEIVVSMDGDGQDDPSELPKLLAKLDEGYDVVCSWRKDRQDSLLKKLPSKLSNFLNRRLNEVPIHDSGCTYRVYRANSLKDLPIKGEMHRYIPALLSSRGYRVTEVAVKHRERKAGTTKYGSGRLYRGFTDLISLNVAFQKGHSPFRFFLKFFNWVFLLGIISWLMAIVQGIWDLEFLGDFDVQFFVLAGLILIVQAFQFLAIAFGLEIMSKNSQGIRGPEYAIAEEIS